MIRPLALLTLTLASLVAADAAADTPGLPPVDPAGATAPQPEAAPAADPGEETAPAAPAAGGRRARPAHLSARAVASGGYDSNVLLLADEAPTATGRSGPAYTLGGEVLWRAIASDRRRLNLVANVEQESYPDHEDQRMLRFGGAATGMLAWGDRLPALTVIGQRYVLDGDTAADVYAANLTVAGITRRRVSLPSLEASRLELTDNDDASGTFVAAGYRHWWLLEAGNSRRRIEGGVRLGHFDAGTDAESYTALRPDLAVVYRFGQGQRAGTVDLGARAGLDLRRYHASRDATSDERQTNVALGLELDRWFCRYAAAGVFARETVRESTVAARDFDRFQTGVRLIASF